MRSILLAILTVGSACLDAGADRESSQHTVETTEPAPEQCEDTPPTTIEADCTVDPKSMRGEVTQALALSWTQPANGTYTVTCSIRFTCFRDWSITSKCPDGSTPVLAGDEWCGEGGAAQASYTATPSVFWAGTAQPNQTTANDVCESYANRMDVTNRCHEAKDGLKKYSWVANVEDSFKVKATCPAGMSCADAVSAE